MAKISLRDYQSKSLSMLYDWLSVNNGNPAVILPTGSGKSIVIAELCRKAITEYPETRILMLTRSVELINQNAEKLLAIWDDAPMGIYSASAGKKQLGNPITIGGPLSVVRILPKLGKIDLLICDECHDISHKDEGSYRKIINLLMNVNPSMRVIGYTASPFRLGHGMITDKPAIFDALINPISIAELVSKKYLSTLKSKQTSFNFDTSNVHKRGGDFVESELQKAVDTNQNNISMIDEVINRAGNRKSWMFFATGVQHAKNLKDILISKGISAVAVTGEMPKAQREQAISDFKSGKITAVTQVNCLNVGFDHPDIDLLVMARPTMSPGLYLQQAGRGMRPKSHTDHCLVLDFAGNVSRHGPITAIQPPRKAGKGTGEMATKQCPECSEIVLVTAQQCPSCQHQFTDGKEKKILSLHDDDIMGLDPIDMDVTLWAWRVHTSRTSGKKMLKLTYYGALSDPPVVEYFPVLHDGYAGNTARASVAEIALRAGVDYKLLIDIDISVKTLQSGKPPKSIKYRRDGKFFKIMRRNWVN